MMDMNQRLLQQLSLKISELKEQTTLCQHTVLNASCFDEQLFKPSLTKHSSYQRYFDEISGYYQKLRQLVEQNNPLLNHSAEIEFLTTKLVNQMSALSRQLVTRQPPHNNIETENTSIFEKHAQYLGYLRKLEWIKSELMAKGNSLLEVEKINERIGRCQLAIENVEKEIELCERLT